MDVGVDGNFKEHSHWTLPQEIRMEKVEMTMLMNEVEDVGGDETGD